MWFAVLQFTKKGKKGAILLFGGCNSVVRWMLKIPPARGQFSPRHGPKKHVDAQSATAGLRLEKECRALLVDHDVELPIRKSSLELKLPRSNHIAWQLGEFAILL